MKDKIKTSERDKQREENLFVTISGKPLTQNSDKRHQKQSRIYVISHLFPGS